MDQVRPRLIRAGGSRNDTSFPLDNPVAVIGWGGHCDIRIGAPGVARTHCVLVRDGNTVYFRDLSGREVAVNGAPLGEGFVVDGDLLAVGDATFRVQIPGADLGPMATAPDGAVLIRAGKAPAESFDLAERVTVVGSHRNCQVNLDHEGVASLHCLFARTSMGLYLRDLESGNTTLVNGEQATILLLEGDDEILIGPCAFHLRLGGWAETTDPDAGGVILIVEPNASNRRALGRILDDGGHEIRTAATANEFLDRMMERPAELVILSAELPDAEGLELCKTIKKDAQWSDAAVIMTSGGSFCEASFAAGFAAGACDFLAQPFIRAEVLGRVQARIREKRDRQKYRELASVDGLTGLLNRRAMEQRLIEAVSQSRRRRHAVGVILADLDRFKRCNDRYGHETGDQVLRAFARLLRQSCRQEDILTRYGGEEFCVILPHTSLAQTRALADRLRRRWARTIFHARGSTARFTASFGVSCYRPDQGSDREGPKDLIREADVALYTAKRHGRNRVVCADDILPERAAAAG